MSIDAIDTRYDVYERRPLLAGLLPDLPPIGRLGVAVLAVGWVLVLLEPLLPALIPNQAAAGAVVRIGQSAIVTGAGLAVLGLLMTIGLRGAQSARTRVALRTDPSMEPERAMAATPPAVVSPPVASVSPPGVAFAAAAPAVQPAPVPPAPQLPVSASLDPVARSIDQAPPFAKPAAESAVKPAASVTLPISGSMVVVARGQVDDRCFLILSDGSMVIETLLGQRRFRSLEDARDFIGGGNFLLHDTVNIPLKPVSTDATVKASRVLRHV